MPDTRSNPPVDPPAVRRSGDADDQITLSSDRPAPGQIVIEVGGEVDMLTSPQLRAAVLEQFEPAASVELRLACTARRVLRPLTIAGLVPLFDIHPTLDEALAAT